MNNLFLLFFIILILGFFLYFFRNKIYILFNQDDDSDDAAELYRYKKKEFLLNIPERRFFEELQKVVPNNFVTFPQVVLSNIVEVDSPRDKAYKYRNQINRRVIDFVIFEKPYYKPILAIEYDGKTHNHQSRRERDFKVNKILESSGIKIIHVQHRENINFDNIFNVLKNN